MSIKPLIAKAGKRMLSTVFEAAVACVLPVILSKLSTACHEFIDASAQKAQTRARGAMDTMQAWSHKPGLLS